MDILKIGSKGEEVKKLQRLLGVTADGIFGTITQNEVKKFQQSHGLVSDGIVTKNVWDALLNNAQSKDIQIIKDPLNVHITRCGNRDIKYIVVHYTGSGNSKSGKAKSTKASFISRSASADFCIDDTSIVQFNPDIKNYYCWHCGGNKYPNTKGAKFYKKCTNKNSIGIEICSTNTGTFNATNHSGWSYTEQVLDNAEQLIKYLMKKYNISVDNVIRHYDVSGKHCPGIIGWNDEPITDPKTGKNTGSWNNSEQWFKFKQRLIN